MAITGSCHCGAVKIEVPSAPEWLGRCNCSFCRRIGAMMAYYPDDGAVRIDADQAQDRAPGDELPAEAAEMAGLEVRIATAGHSH